MRILLLEDDDALRTELSEYFSRRLQTVTACGSLAEARAVLSTTLDNNPPDAIVCDNNLPDGSGLDFCLEIEPRLPGCQWILMSGAHDPDQVESKLSSLCERSRFAIVDKPVSFKQLNQLLQQMAKPDSL